MVEQNKNTKPEDDSPSTQRRNDLREADSKESNIPTVSTFFPLERYYAASDKLLEIFETAYTKKSLDEAYIYGIRYSDFVVKGIPKHDYYKSTKFSSRRIESIRRVQDVMSKVENIVKLMDEEEIEKEKRRKALIERQKRERERIQREREAKQLQELQARIAKQKEDYSSSFAAANGPSSGTTAATNNVEESALAKLQRLSQPHQQQPIPPAMPPPPDKRVSFSEDTTFSDASTNGSASVLPPPLLPPPEGHEDDKSPVAAPANNGVVAPPPYNQILGQSKNYFGQKRPTEEASSTGSGAVDPALPSYDAVVKKQKPSIKKQQQQQPKRPPKAPTHNIRQHIAQCRQVHLQYLQQRKIQISPLKTYQGRVNGSTNGCTVISACVVSRHLENKGGASSDLVQNVIDRDCIPLLRSIRSKLGLTGSALIIPSDVHDHLVDHKWLFQHKFVGAAGGNVTDPNHLGELFNLLQGEPNKTSHLRSAATFFFREHVISIVKFPTSYTDAVYDVIDSLPTCNGGASRTRCSSIQALKVHMEKYTCSKFSDSNCSYIERNRWDDSMADFDPRVFQTFVWADLPKPKE